MRHVKTLIAALVIAPLAWILMAFGQDRSALAFANATHSSSPRTADFIEPLLLLAAAGVVLGLIATLRFSPLGAVVAGFAYTATYATLLIAPRRLMDLFVHHVSVAGHRADLSTPIRTGTALLVGATLLVAAASVDRWRRWPRPADTVSDSAYEHDRPLGVDGLGMSRNFDDQDRDLAFARPMSTAHAGPDSVRGRDFGPR
jgi:hypothetical protein